MANAADQWRYVQLALLCVACCTALYAVQGQVATAVSQVWSSVDYDVKGNQALSSQQQAIMQSELQILYGTVNDVKALNFQCQSTAYHAKQQ